MYPATQFKHIIEKVHLDDSLAVIDPSLYRKRLNFLHMLKNNPLSFLTLDSEPLTVTKEYSVRNGNTIITGHGSFWMRAPIIINDNEFNSIIKEIYQLDDNAVSRAHEIFKNQVISFIQNIPNIQPTELSNKCIEKDLYYLVNNTPAHELTETINRLKASSVNYSTFEIDTKNHIQEIVNTYDVFINTTELRKNLLIIFFHIASMQNDKTPWLYKNETHEMLANFALKALVMPVYYAAFVFLTAFTAAFCATLPIISLLLITNPILATITSIALCVGLLVGLSYAIKYEDDILKQLNQPMIDYANYIDKMTEDAFNPQSQILSTELASTLFSASRATFFNSAESRQDTHTASQPLPTP